MTKRRRFTERQVLETLIRQGIEIRCYRTNEVITLETVKTMEREHLVPVALGGADDPTNCAYSLGSAHKIQTNGNGHTSHGSDKHLIAKLNPKRIAKFVVRKGADCAGEDSEPDAGRQPKLHRQFPKGRKLQSRGFSKQHRPMRRKSARREQKEPT